MKKKEFISTNQFVWMLFSVITSFTTLQIPGLLIYHAGRDAWLSVACAWFADVLLAIVYAYMGLRFPGQNMMQYSMTILGKYAGRIVATMFSIFFLLVSAVLMRSLTSLINNVFLPKTPIEITLALTYLLIAYGVRKGIESIARTCEFLGPIYLISLFSLFALLIPEVKLHRLKPVFLEGFYPSLTGIPIILSFIGICIIMGMYIPICNRPENGFRAKLIAVSMGAFVIELLFFVSVGIFGAEQAGNMINPSYQLARLVNIGNFWGRLEIIWFMVSIAAGILTSASLIWAFSLGISQISGLSSYKPLVYPAVLISYILSISSFNNSIDIFNFQLYTYAFVAVSVETGLEMFLFLTALIFKKRGNEQGVVP